MNWSSALTVAALAFLTCAPPARAAEHVPAVFGIDPMQAAFSVFVRRLPPVQEPRLLPFRRPEVSGAPQPVTTTEFGARLRLTAHSNAYLKVLKFRATVPPARRGVQAPSHTMLDRPRAKAITAGIKFAF